MNTFTMKETLNYVGKRICFIYFLYDPMSYLFHRSYNNPLYSKHIVCNNYLNEFYQQ